MASRARIFFRTLLSSYVIVGYGVPVACVLYHDTIKSNHSSTRSSFKHSDKCFVFPFYHPRTSVEDTIRTKLQSKSGQFLFIYGKPRVGKSTIVRKVCSQLQDGILRMNTHSLQPFHQNLANYLNFTFHDQYSWHNLKNNMHFPLALCITNPRNDHSQHQFHRILEYLSTFCKTERPCTDPQRPWTLIIDDADGMDRDQFEALYSNVIELIDQDLLTVVVISSDPVFAAFISNKAKFDKISRVQIDEMDRTESSEFLKSSPCSSFVNRMRTHNGTEPISIREQRQCTRIAGGIPIHLVQSAVQSPMSWHRARIKALRTVLDQQENEQNAYRMQSYMVSQGNSSLDFKEFVRASGGVEDAIKLLHGSNTKGLTREQRQHWMFFHDLDRDAVTLQYEYLMTRPIPSPRPQTRLKR